MLIVRMTNKLMRAVRGAPLAWRGERSDTVLGDWFATMAPWRSQVVMLVNRTTLLPVFMETEPLATLTERIPDAIATVLRRHGAPNEFVAAELAAMRDVRVWTTDDQGVVGVMNTLAPKASARWSSGMCDLVDLSVDIARVPVGPLRYRAGSPDRELAAVLTAVQGGGAGVPGAYRIKATIAGTKPPVWRRVVVGGSSTLHELHEVLQAAFGWWNCHLYDFVIDRRRFTIPDPDFGDDVGLGFGEPNADPREVLLADVASTGMAFTYTYDFGDFWEHKLVVESVTPAGSGRIVPACIGGRRACPPEDCGGAAAYAAVLAILADPAHPQHDIVATWAAGDGTTPPFDPDAFDPTAFADNLDAVRATTFEL